MHYIWVLLSTIVGLIMTNARIVFPSPTDNFQAETDDDNMPPPWRDQVYQKNLLPPDDSLDFMLTSSSKYDKAMPESLQKFPFVPPERIARQLVLITVQHPMLIIQGKFYQFPYHIISASVKKTSCLFKIIRNSFLHNFRALEFPWIFRKNALSSSL